MREAWMLMKQLGCDFWEFESTIRGEELTAVLAVSCRRTLLSQSCGCVRRLKGLRAFTHSLNYIHLSYDISVLFAMRRP